MTTPALLVAGMRVAQEEAELCCNCKPTLPFGPALLVHPEPLPADKASHGLCAGVYPLTATLLAWPGSNSTKECQSTAQCRKQVVKSESSA